MSSSRFTTKELEHMAYQQFWRRGWYGCFEIAVPRAIQNKYHRERVDLLTYETSGVFRAYEIKRDKSDFYSGFAWSWIGDYNYFIMPKELYDEVKQDIPDGIGVWCAYKTKNRKWLHCERNPKRRQLLCSPTDLMFSLMQGLSREYKKYRKILEKQT